MSKRYIYFFDEVDEVEEICGHDKNAVLSLLGSKGGNLAWIAKLGVPVPKGFTITTEACNDFYSKDPPLPPEGLWEEQKKAIQKLEEKTGKKFGSSEKPLLLSCRSGAKTSMPGMMDTVLNLGLNDVTVQSMIKLTKNPRFVWDSYRRLMQGYGSIVLGIDESVFEKIVKKAKQEKNIESDADCSAEDWQEVVDAFKKVILKESGKEFPQDPFEQIKEATLAVFNSWNSARAIDYREKFKIPNNLGTAANIMAMVFGNMGDTSATGVAFTRDPSTGEKRLWGDFLLNAQGEDVVAGTHGVEPIDDLEDIIPRAYRELTKIASKLEWYFKDMQDIEFTIEQGKLWVLQTRSGKRTAQASIKIACEMVNEGLITIEDAISRIQPKEIDQLLQSHFKATDLKNALQKRFATGLNTSPGAGVGHICFSPEKCKAMSKEGKDVVFVHRFTKPDDIGGMLVAKGIVTQEGGSASHAAVIARQLGIPAVTGCNMINVDSDSLTMTSNGVILHEGDIISVDGTTGQVFNGALPLTRPKLEDQAELMTVLSWADEIRSRQNARKSVYNGPTRGLQIWANADLPDDAKHAREFGAEGIGLCRTEHMFLGNRAELVTKLILSDSDDDRNELLNKLETYQTQDFITIFEAMSGLPTIVRLIDPPLNDFLPEHSKLIEEVAVLRTKKELGKEIDEKLLEEKEKLLERSTQLHESNPSIGIRGVRLCLVIPGLVRMQIRAILEGAFQTKTKGFNPMPEIMVPLTMDVSELERIKPIFDEVVQEVQNKYKTEINVKFGTMIEVPRAALTSGEIAKLAEFYSFGTNDLHQMTLGLSRDDSEGTFLQNYYEWGMLKESPFKTIDQNGVGRLMKIAIKDGRKVRKDLSVGISGEHGGDPKSIDFCHRIGMNYVSCAPSRIPVARLAAAQAVLNNPVDEV